MIDGYGEGRVVFIINADHRRPEPNATATHASGHLLFRLELLQRQLLTERQLLHWYNSY